MRFNLKKLILISAGVLFVAVFLVLGFVDLSKWIGPDAGGQPTLSTRTRVDLARLVEKSDNLGSGQKAAETVSGEDSKGRHREAREDSGISDVQGISGKTKDSETEKPASENDTAKPSNKGEKPEKGIDGQAAKAKISKGASGAAVSSGPSATDAPKAADKRKPPSEEKKPPVVVVMRKDAPGDDGTSKQAKASDKAGAPKDHKTTKRASGGDKGAQKTTLQPDETEQTGARPKTQKGSGAESAEGVEKKPAVTLVKVKGSDKGAKGKKEDDGKGQPQAAGKKATTDQKGDLAKQVAALDNGEKQKDIESKGASAGKKVAASAQQDPAHGKTKPKEGKPAPDGGDNVRKIYIRKNEGRIRERPSLDAPIKTTLKVGTELLAGSKKGDWYAVRLKDGREGWGHQSILGDTPPTVAAASAGKDRATSSSRKINRIRTEKLSDQEIRVVFELNGKYPPKEFTIKGKKPRMVYDFPNTKISDMVKLTMNIESGLLKRIRVGVHRRPAPKTRVVLDLVDNLNFVANPVFIEKNNYYAVVIRRQD